MVKVMKSVTKKLASLTNEELRILDDATYGDRNEKRLNDIVVKYRFSSIDDAVGRYLEWVEEDI